MDGRGSADTVEFTGVFARFRLYLNEPRGLYRLDQTLGEVPVRVGNAAFHLLRLLLEQKGRPVSKKALKSEAWGTEDEAGDWDDNLRVEIGKLRASLGENAHNSCIQRELRGGGYRYNEHEIPVPSGNGSGAHDVDNGEISPNTLPNSALLLAIIKAATEELRALTEEQRQTIHTLRKQLPSSTSCAAFPEEASGSCSSMIHTAPRSSSTSTKTSQRPKATFRPDLASAPVAGDRVDGGDPRETSGMLNPLSPRRGDRQLGEPSPGKSLPRWPCLLPSIVVGVVPLRNLTGEADKQGLVEGFTDRLVTDLFRQCRGVSFAWVADERRCACILPPRNPPELSYVVYGSVQRGSYGMLRINIRISDALTANYLWAGRQEFGPEDVAPIQTKITLVNLPSASYPARSGGQSPRGYRTGCGTGGRGMSLPRGSCAQKRDVGRAHRRGTAMVSRRSRR
jgi:TolB-like protein/DNA-binding winged helix-turn-helix (wHTH) protein